MNECFFAGKIIDIYKFKFIYNKKINHKCVINFKLQLLDNQLIELIAFDELVDEVIANKFKFVYIYAEIIDDMNTRIKEIFEGGNLI